MDWYALFGGLGIPAVVLFAEWRHWIPISIVAYLLVEMLVCTVKVQFIDCYDRYNRPHSPSRSVVLLLMGYGTAVLAFAVFFAASEGVFESSSPNVAVTKPGSMLYFSLITIATVGYGDLHPKLDTLAMWLVIFEVVIGIVMIVVLLTRFLGLSIEAWEGNGTTTGGRNRPMPK